MVQPGLEAGEVRSGSFPGIPGNIPAHRDAAAQLSFFRVSVPFPEAGQQQFGVGTTLVGLRQSSGLNPCFFRHAGSKEAAWGAAKGILFF